MATINGTNHGDSLVGTATNDVFYGFNGDDFILGEAGNDRLFGGNGTDHLSGGIGADRLFGGNGDDVLDGNSGNDVLSGGRGNDAMSGGTGNDTYYIDDFGDTVFEAAAEGTDRVISSVTYTLTGNVENLTLVGTSAISGVGNELNNSLKGNAGDNSLTGGGGNDTLNGGRGADTLVGGAGNDRYYVDNAGDVVLEAAGEGTDRVYASVSFALGDHFENLTLTGTAATSGTGNAGANTIAGNAAPNTLSGKAGNDVIKGGAGADSLYGGDGHDSLTGGAGTDKFYFDTALNGSSNVDKILDFKSVDDLIHLDLAVFAGIESIGALSSDAFRLGTAAGDADDRIVYDQATGRIFYDADGTGVGAAVLFAQVAAGTTLSSEDFFGYV